MIKKIFAFVPLFLSLTFIVGQLDKNYRLQNYLNEKGNTEEIIGFFVKGNKQKIRALCNSHNGKYHSSVKGWHYVKIPSNQLELFSSNKLISNLHISLYKGCIHNDTMRVNNRVNYVHSGTGALNNIPYSGKDVVMGFLDTGIDWNHGDFKNPDGSTRIIALWDQTLPVSTNTPPNYGYGQQWDSTEINASSGISHTDYDGHGTTVTGTAAGNGFANGTHKGVAPEADIVAVEINFNSSNFLGSVVDGTEYIFHIADSLGKPCVINGSLGTYFGSHDGLDPYSLYIDSLINEKKGRLFVCSAGNSGNWGPYHLHAEVNNDSTFTWLKPFAGPPGFPPQIAFYELWADTADFNQLEYCVGADMHSPYYNNRGMGEYFDVLSNINSPSSLLSDVILNSNGDQIASVMYYAEQMDGQYMLQVFVATDSSDYNYRFQIKGTGKYDAWSEFTHLGVSDIVSANELPSSNAFPEIINYTSPDTLCTIVSAFQCLPSVITVGNYANDSGYVNNLSNWVSTNTVRGKLSANSSKGPTRIGLQKPDISASGDITLSACRLDFIPFLDDSVLAYGGLHLKNGGTSMSSPVVAGIAALYLEKCSNSSHEKFKNDLLNNAYSDSFSTNLPDYGFGFGKADAYSTLVSTSFTPNILNNSFCSDEDSTEVRTEFNYPFYSWSSGESTSLSYYQPSQNEFVLVTDSNGCKSDTAFFDVIEHPIPSTPTISVSFDQLLTDPGYSNYQWYINGTLLNGETDSILTVIINGIYQVEVFDQNNCSSLSNGLLYESVHVNEIENELNLYPTPTNSLLNVFSSVNIMSYQIINSNGQQVLNKNVAFPSKFISIDVSLLSKGLYFIVTHHTKGSSIKKFNSL